MVLIEHVHIADFPLTNPTYTFGLLYRPAALYALATVIVAVNMLFLIISIRLMLAKMSRPILFPAIIFGVFYENTLV